MMLRNVKKGARRVYVRKPASHYVGKQCTDVMDEMRACGFSDIATIKEKDLVKGCFTRVGDVVSISIDGNSCFQGGKDFPSDAKVIIEYHAFQN